MFNLEQICWLATAGVMAITIVLQIIVSVVSRVNRNNVFTLFRWTNAIACLITPIWIFYWLPVENFDLGSKIFIGLIIFIPACFILMPDKKVFQENDDIFNLSINLIVNCFMIGLVALICTWPIIGIIVVILIFFMDKIVKFFNSKKEKVNEES